MFQKTARIDQAQSLSAKAAVRRNGLDPIQYRLRADWPGEAFCYHVIQQLMQIACNHWGRLESERTAQLQIAVYMQPQTFRGHRASPGQGSATFASEGKSSFA